MKYPLNHEKKYFILDPLNIIKLLVRCDQAHRYDCNH